MRLDSDEKLIFMKIDGRKGYWMNTPENLAMAENVDPPKSEPPAPKKKKPAHTTGQMNSVERWYYENVLLPKKERGEYQEIYFERYVFTLAFSTPGGKRSTTFRPDFVVVLPTGALECHEVKAESPPKPRDSKKPWNSMKESSRVKIKMAAELFPFHHWEVVYVCLPLQKWREEIQ